MDKEFEEKCLNRRTITVEPAVSRIEDDRTMQHLSKQHKNNSEYFLEGTKALLKSSAPLLAVLTGYFAMEHKANQILALKGYKVESHICVQIALSRVLGRRALAKKISRVFELRQNIGYRMFLAHSEEERENTEKIINGDIIPFIREIDGLIEKEDY